MAADDPVKKAIAKEKERLKKKVDDETELNQYLRDYFNSLPSRVKIDGSELIIEPEPPMKNILRYLRSSENLGSFGSSIGLVVAIGAIITMSLSIGTPPNYDFPISYRQMSMGIMLVLFIYFGRGYVQDVFEGISELNETFHLKVSGKNFMVHSGNPEEHIAASTIFASDGEWNIKADIDENRGELTFDWAYGPDINNLITGEREFRAYRIPGVRMFLDEIDLLERLSFGLLRFDPVGQPPLSLKDIDTVRKFLKENGIKIENDRRIGE